jgi:T5SS/PEP-CTERM-associated repeat protein
VLSGAAASTVGTIIGNSNLITGQSLATGVVNVDGAGSRWTVNATTSNVSFISVGGVGNGTLNITKGGRVDATYLNVGVDNGSTGTLTIDGAGSLPVTGGTQQFGGLGFWWAGTPVPPARSR